MNLRPKRGSRHPASAVPATFSAGLGREPEDGGFRV